MRDPRHHRRRCHALGTAVLVTLCLAPLAARMPAQVQIESVRWGFDQRWVAGCFNLVTVAVRNPTGTAFRGMLELVEGGGMAPRGAPYTADCFLAPGDERTIQLVPFVGLQAFGAWLLRIGADRREITLGAANSSTGNGCVRQGQAAFVQLVAAATEARPSRLAMFRDAGFPATVAATGGLACIALDHVPDFQPAQAQAFLDWLHGGGELHLFHDGNAFPRFGSALAALDDPRERVRIGHGLLVRHPRAISRGERFPEIDLPPPPPEDEAATSGDQLEGALGQLARIVRPAHDWRLLFFILGAFFVAVVPLHWWLSLRRVGAGLSISILLLIVLLAWFAVRTVGRRGYGEESSIHSLSYAKVLAPGRFDVSTCANAFSTEGRSFSIRYPASGSVYSATTQETVPGRILTGPAAAFEVVVPLFTSRGWLHRGVFRADPLDVAVQQVPSDRPLGDALRIVWRGPRVLGALAFHRGRFRELGASQHADVLRPTGPFQTSLQTDDIRTLGYGRFEGDGRIDLDKLASTRFRPLLAAHWGSDSARLGDRPGMDDAIRLVVLCRADAAFAPADVGGTTARYGCVLFDIELPIH